MDEKTGEGTFIISAPVVEKTFINKRGKIQKFTDYYVQRSIQDYFIKFCESGITRKELEKALARQKDSLIKTLTMEVEIKKGFWDSCGPELVQSRTGAYMIIHRIIHKK